MTDLKLFSGLSAASAFLYAMIVVPSLLGSVATGIGLIVGLFLSVKAVLGKLGTTHRSFECRLAEIVCLSYFFYFAATTVIAGGEIKRLMELALIIPALLFPAIFRFIDMNTSAVRPIWVGRVAAIGLIPVILVLGILPQVPGTTGHGLMAGNPNILGGVLAIQIVLTFAGWHLAGLLERLAIAVLALISACSIYFFTGNDGAFLALIVSALFALFPVSKLLWSKGKGSWSFVVGVALMSSAAITLMAIFLLLPIKITFPTTEYWPSSSMQRLIMHQTGVEAFLDHLLFGVGLHDRFNVTLEYHPTPPPDGFWFSHLHNFFLTHAVAGGFFGAALSVAILLTPSFILRMTPMTTFGNMLSGALIGVGLTEVLLLNDLKMTVTLSMIALCLALRNAGKSLKDAEVFGRAQTIP